MGNTGCCTQDDNAVAPPNGKGRNSQQQLQMAVDGLFRKYDTDNNGYLQRQEVQRIIDAALIEAGASRGSQDEEVQQLISKSDKNNDGKISKDELFKLFRNVAKNKKK